MNSAEQNFRLLREIEESRRFLLLACSQNSQLLAHADTRIVELMQQDAAWQAQGKENAPHPARSKQSGVSLVELIMFMVIVSVAVVGVLQVMNRVTTSSADPMLRKQAIAVAESVLEEIELKAFAKPAGGFAGPFTLANRANFDTVTDYNGLTTGGAGITSASTGAAVANLGAYNFTVAVVPTALGVVPAAASVLITVTVTDPQGGVVQISGYRTNY